MGFPWNSPIFRGHSNCQSLQAGLTRDTRDTRVRVPGHLGPISLAFLCAAAVAGWRENLRGFSAAGWENQYRKIIGKLWKIEI